MIVLSMILYLVFNAKIRMKKEHNGYAGGCNDEIYGRAEKKKNSYHNMNNDRSLARNEVTIVKQSRSVELSVNGGWPRESKFRVEI